MSASGPTLPVLSQSTQICLLLTWKDPAKTASVFAALISALILVKSVNLINLFFRVCFFSLLGLGLTEYVSLRFLEKGIISSYKPLKRSYAECFNKNALPLLGQYLVCAEDKLHCLVNVSNAECTLKAAGLSFIAYHLTAYFSIFSLLCLTVVSAFTLPLIYSTFKSDIDCAMSQATALFKREACKILDLTKAAAKPYFEAAIAKAEPVLKLVRPYLPAPTCQPRKKTECASKVEIASKTTDSPKQSVATEEDVASIVPSKTDVTVEVNPDFTGEDLTIDESYTAFSTGLSKAGDNSEISLRPSASSQVVEEIKAASESGSIQ